MEKRAGKVGYTTTPPVGPRPAGYPPMPVSKTHSKMVSDSDGAVTIDRLTVGCAIFALGRFIDYRLNDGMAAVELEWFMQAYLNLEAAAEGREPLDLQVLQAQTVTVSPEERQAILTVSPAWLPDGEKLRHIRQTPCNCPCTTAPDAQA